MLYIDPWPLGGPGVRAAGECWPIMFALDAWLCFGQLGGTGPWETFTRPPVWRHTGQPVEGDVLNGLSFSTTSSWFCIWIHMMFSNLQRLGCIFPEQARWPVASARVPLEVPCWHDVAFLTMGRKVSSRKKCRIFPCNCSLAFYRCHWPSWGWCNRGVLARHCYEVTTNGREFTSWGTRSLVVARLLHQVVTMYLLRMQSIKFDLSQRTGR